MSEFRISLFGLILIAYLVLGTLYALLTPAWQAPDEPAHYNYVRYLATEPGFPELVGGCYDQAYLEQLTAHRFPPDLPINRLCYEFHQPPLYYLLAAPIFRLSHGSLIALRLFSLGLGMGVVVLAFFIGRAIFPGHQAIALGTMAFVSFVPMHLAMLASVNNDALAELILAILLSGLTRRLLADRTPSTMQDVWLGVVLGLGLVTKTTVYIALPLVAVTLWLASDRTAGRLKNRVDWAALARQGFIIYGLALLMALPWYLRNSALYGRFDILGLGRHDQVVAGQLRTVNYIADIGWRAYLGDFARTTFHSFWGQFGWMAAPMDGRSYLFLTLLTLMALGGLVGYWLLVIGYWRSQKIEAERPVADRLLPGQSKALLVMGLTVILMALAYGGYNLTFKQFQGRYLFPALIPLGLFFTLGLQEALARRRAGWLVAGLAVAFGWVVVSSIARSGLDKWAVLITGLALGMMMGRAVLARYWLVPTPWLVAACYGLLGLLALVSPFWFIIPHLSF
jgi:4-amino-4-deoxy-L-arabinose transferase-like glycosyltransferase